MRHTKITRLVMSIFLLVLALPCVYALGIGTFEKELRYTPDETAIIKYYIIKKSVERPTINIGIEGDLAQYTTFNTNNYWYSGKVDELDVRLSHEFDLRNISSATLTFQTMYNIEYGWDFGYVEISTNNGSTWSQLAGTGTTTFRDGAAYVGVPGAPAYTGVVSSWTLETVDLTQYVGNTTIIRFRYVNDEYYGEHGWLIDDIAISDIGFFDDVESANTTWTSDGWVNDVLYLDDNTTTFEIEAEFNIPDSYVSNGSDNRIIVAEIPGADAGFNPTYSSVPQIIAKLPPLVKVPKPVTPPSGGGGSSGGSSYSQHLTYRKGVVHYIVDRFFPGKSKTLNIDKADSLVRRVDIIVNKVVDDSIIRITPLDNKPTMIKQDLKGVYRFFEVSTSRLFDSDIDEATLVVSVPKSWVEKEGKLPEDIIVSRFSRGSWSDLPTVFVDEDRDNYYYEVTTPGFSVFAVRLDYPIEDPEIIIPVPTVKPDVADMKPVLVIENRTVDEIEDSVVNEIILKTGADESEVRAAIDDTVKIQGTVIPETPKRSVKKVVSGIVAVLFLLSAFVLTVISRRISSNTNHAKHKKNRKSVNHREHEK